jgi:hypothetical protein
MKRVLIISFDFPPYVSVGGLRPYNWYVHLSEFGVEPIVVTRQWSNEHGNYLDYVSAGESSETIVKKTAFGTVLNTSYRPNVANRLLLKHGEKKYTLLRKSISAYYEFAQFIKPMGPKVGLYYGARDFLKKNKVDAIIATGDPFVLFSYAAKLSKEFGIPWIADYRDPWSHEQKHIKNAPMRAWNAFLEKKIVSSASHISTVSTFVFSKINQLIPNKPFSILPNGYNEKEINQIREIPQKNEILTIAFIGTIYNWHPIKSFLGTTEKYLQNKADCSINLNFYGTNINTSILDVIKQDFPSLTASVMVTSKMPNDELLRKLAEANVMLLFNDYSYMGTKIFDYIGVKRKIILCYSNDAEASALKEHYYTIEEIPTESKQLQADLIEKTNAGVVVKDADHLLEVLEELYIEFEATGKIACNSIGVENYSHKKQVEKLAELILNIK